MSDVPAGGWTADTLAALLEEADALHDGLARLTPKQKAAWLLPRLGLPSAPPQQERPRVYIASRTRHAARWVALRDSGYPIAASWIDEAAPDQTVDYGELMTRCLNEARGASAILLYAEGDDCKGWKGAWFELGAALGAGVPAFFAGVHDFPSPLRHPSVTICASLDDALTRARQASVDAALPPAPSAAAIEAACQAWYTAWDEAVLPWDEMSEAPEHKPRLRLRMAEVLRASYAVDAPVGGPWLDLSKVEQ